MASIFSVHQLRPYRHGKKRLKIRPIQFTLVFGAGVCAVLLVGLMVLKSMQAHVIGGSNSYSNVSKLISLSHNAPVSPKAQQPALLLSIPKLKENIPYITVALTKNGEMAVPLDTGYAGLYKYGAKPGQVGNAVIDGHNQILGNGNGVFWNINKLTPGDDLYVQDSTLNRVHFVVTHTEKYAFDNAPMKNIFGPSDKAHLNLITCSGTWSKALHSYTQRLVVYADLSS